MLYVFFYMNKKKEFFLYFNLVKVFSNSEATRIFFSFVMGILISQRDVRIISNGQYGSDLDVFSNLPVRSKQKMVSSIPVSLGGQDTRLSPERPGFNSRTGNIFCKRYF